MTLQPNADSSTLRIELENVLPLVWRRVIVPGSWTFAKLHDYLQWVMGWNDSHAHEFEAGERLIAAGWWIQEIAQDRDTSIYRDERRVRIEAIAAEVGIGGEFTYCYDMGDDWRHRIVVEATPETLSKELALPRCVAGEHACPPDDVGGPPGYERFLEILADREHEEHADMLRWIGGVFDPKGFDLNRINRDWRGGKRRKG